MTTNGRPLITSRQADVMRILWADGSATVREAKQKINDDLAYTSVLTACQTLEERGHVRHEHEGKAYRYFPVTSREEAAEAFAEHLWSMDGTLAQKTRDKIQAIYDRETS